MTDKEKGYNKGEWSELYAKLKILAEGKITVADENLKPTDEVYNVEKIFISAENTELEFLIENDDVVINGLKISKNVFKTYSLGLYNDIVKNKQLKSQNIKQKKYLDDFIKKSKINIESNSKLVFSMQNNNIIINGLKFSGDVFKTYSKSLYNDIVKNTKLKLQNIKKNDLDDFIKKSHLDTNSELEFLIQEDCVLINGEQISKDNFKTYSQSLYNDIQNKSSGFTWKNISDEKLKDFIEEYNIKIKTGAETKTDLKIQVKGKKLNYSIKSLMGKAVTVLNASNLTNFVYKIKNLKTTPYYELQDIIKISEKIKIIKKLGGTIKFCSVKNQVFNDNLSIIDSDLPQILGKLLLKSYIKNSKNISAFEEEQQKIVLKLIKSSIFGMVPGSKYIPENEINGGILFVKKTSELVLLKKDPITLDSFLKKTTYFDTPSTTRYDIMNVFKCENNYLFFLNLQIRLKFKEE